MDRQAHGASCSLTHLDLSVALGVLEETIDHLCALLGPATKRVLVLLALGLAPTAVTAVGGG